MTKLLNFNPVKNVNDIKSLRYLYDNCEIQIRSLASMGVVSDTYGSLLCPILMKLIPEEITLDFSKQVEEDDVWKVEELMSFIQKEVDSRERTANMSKSGKERTSAEREKETPGAWEMRTRRHNTMTTSTLYAANQMDRQYCFFCEKNNHQSKHCHEMSVPEKKEKLKNQGRCFVCFGTRHVAKDCRTRGISCEKCNRRHHQAVCSYDGREFRKENEPADAVMSMSPSESKRESVLLQTATVWIETPVTRQLTRCLLDGGSQRSFVRKDISSALNLPKVGEETLKLHTFGSSVPQNITCNKVKLTLSNIRNGQSVQLEMLEIPRVCSSIMRVAGEEVRRELERKGLQLADTSVSGMETQELGVLIGGDHYWKIVTGKLERLSVALDSKFGWLIQGTVSMLNVTTETEPTDVGTLHVSVGLDEKINHTLRSFWEIE